MSDSSGVRPASVLVAATYGFIPSPLKPEYAKHAVSMSFAAFRSPRMVSFMLSGPRFGAVGGGVTLKWIARR